MRAALPSFASARAVLIGTAAYRSASLTDIPHSLQNVRGLGDVLTDPALSGFAPQHVVTVADPDRPEEVMLPVTAAAEEATDALLVYYSGHGLLTGTNGDLHLSLTGSEPDQPWTSLPFSYLAEAVKLSRADVKIVILDCCFSGRAHSDLMGEGSVVIRGQMPHHGMYCLTSAPETKRSTAPEGDTYSAFTGFLLTAMEKGVRDAGPVLRMGDLWDEVCRRMRTTTYPLPEQSSRKNADNFPLVRNRAYLPPPPRTASLFAPRRQGPNPVPLQATTPSGRPSFDTVEGRGYRIGDVNARLDQVIAVASDPLRWSQARPPHFARVSGRGHHGYDRAQVDEHVERHRHQPDGFVDSLRVLLIRQGMELVPDGRPQRRRLAKLKDRSGITGEEHLVGYVRSGWFETRTVDIVCSDRHLCLSTSSDLLRIPYRLLGRVSLATSAVMERWVSVTDQGGSSGDVLVVTTTVSFEYRKVEFSESETHPLQTTLRTFLRGMDELAARHPEWFR
ncbi:caspase domain-containing protein [Streptomyces sp. NPDC059851]|uniref:caspase family protein n=1 Tax=Streptomyces sp. NPDC059851 TaxID=3346971 RepID=UPI00365CBA73